MDVVIYIIAGPLFLISICGHIYVKVWMKREYDSDLDDYYYEFEDRHPALAGYNKWSQITFAGAALSALVLFIAAVF